MGRGNILYRASPNTGHGTSLLYIYFAREEGRGAGFGRRWPSSGAQNKNNPTFSTCYLVCQLSLTGETDACVLASNNASPAQSFFISIEVRM